jgi:hypothetical protein
LRIEGRTGQHLLEDHEAAALEPGDGRPVSGTEFGEVVGREIAGSELLVPTAQVF